MTEPKVEFELNSIKTENVELMQMLDDIRRWHAYREDRKTPAMQTFEGEVGVLGRNIHYVDGNIYGAVGYMKQFDEPDDVWEVMEYDPGNGAYFFRSLEGPQAIEVRGGATGTANATSQYRITVFYRGNPDAN